MQKGKLVIFNENGTIRWDMNIREMGGVWYIQDSSEYSLFPNSNEMGKGLTMGQAIDDFMSKEKAYIEGL